MGQHRHEMRHHQIDPVCLSYENIAETSRIVFRRCQRQFIAASLYLHARPYNYLDSYFGCIYGRRWVGVFTKTMGLPDVGRRRLCNVSNLQLLTIATLLRLVTILQLPIYICKQSNKRAKYVTAPHLHVMNCRGSG